MEELLQAGNRVTSLWLDAMRRLAQPPEATPATPPDPQPNAEAWSHSLGVAVRLKASCPTEVWANLGATPAHHSLALDALRPVQEGPEPLRLVSIARHPNDVGSPVVLSLEVPEGQAPGTYMGLVHDAETRAPVGLVRVRVEAS
jgi:hypothetical protein